MMIDRDEQKIRNAFSQIKVDTMSLERKVRENMNTRNLIKPTPLKRTGFVAAASVAILLFLSVSVYAAATLGVFDRFMMQHDPTFGDVVTPVEIYTVDQGIRIDVIAAQTFGSNAIMYLSVRDISGQNRVTEYANIIPWIDIPRDDERFFGIGTFGGFEPLYFDSETNTAYFQIEVNDVTAIPNVFNLVINEVRLETRRTEADFPVALSSMTEAPLMPNTANFATPESPTWCADYILVPSMGENFPALPGDGWISNVAIINGNLHVQIITPRMEMTETGARNANGNVVSGAMLTAPDGEWVPPINITFLQVDANLRALSVDEQRNMPIEELLHWLNYTYSYDLREVVFPIDVRALDSYALTLSGMFEHSIAGNWSMTVDTGEASEVRSSANVIAIGNASLKSVTVTPMGVSFSGIINGGINDGVASFNGRNVWIETPTGNILVQEFPSVGFSQMYDDDATFIGFARAESPINVSEVIAVIIGDIRIVVG